MAIASANPQRKKKETQFLPRRGQIKARIFESVVKTVASAASKAKEALGDKQRWDFFLCSHYQKVATTLNEMVTHG